jgi:hypothetical protein
MVKSGWLVRGTAMALCALVSGCGDGGGGSVASAGSTATGSTTTSSPPTGVNANLLGPLQSESFANTATQGSLSGTSTSVSSSSAGVVTAKLVYDASAQSYTMTANGKSMTFTPSQISAAQSSTGATVYEVTSGNTTDSLTVTKSGTTGALNYEYVEGAFWEDVSINSQVQNRFGHDHLGRVRRTDTGRGRADDGAGDV